MERCTAYTCFLTFYQQTGKTPYLLQSPLLEAGLYLYNTRFTKVDGVPYPRHFLPLTHISPFWRGYVSNDSKQQVLPRIFLRSILTLYREHFQTEGT